MWAFYGKEARKLQRNKFTNMSRFDVYMHVNDKFAVADVRMMCENFLNVRNKNVLSSRNLMNDAILEAYAKGRKAHSNKQTEHTQTM